MTENEFKELSQSIEDLETKIDKVYELVRVYMEESNYFIAETAGALVTLKNIYSKKSRS